MRSSVDLPEPGAAEEADDLASRSVKIDVVEDQQPIWSPRDRSCGNRIVRSSGVETLARGDAASSTSAIQPALSVEPQPFAPR